MEIIHEHKELIWIVVLVIHAGLFGILKLRTGFHKTSDLTGRHIVAVIVMSDHQGCDKHIPDNVRIPLTNITLIGLHGFRKVLCHRIHNGTDHHTVYLRHEITHQPTKGLIVQEIQLQRKRRLQNLQNRHVEITHIASDTLLHFGDIVLHRGVYLIVLSRNVNCLFVSHLIYSFHCKKKRPNT